MKTLKVFFLIYFLTNSILYAQEPYLKLHNQNISKGLSNNTVFDIFQDKRGFLWFGTNDGLNKYNGYEFEIFNNDNSKANSLSNNTVFSIIEDDKQNLWIGTREGLNVLNIKKNEITRLLETSDKKRIEKIEIFKLFIDSKKNIWVGTNGSGILLFKEVRRNFLRLNLFDDNSEKDTTLRIRTIFEDSEGYFWIGTRNNGLLKLSADYTLLQQYNSTEKDSFQLSNNYIKAVFEDENKILWVGTEGGGISFIDRETGGVLKDTLKEVQSSVKNEFVRCIEADDYGNIWIGTRIGLYRYQIKSKSIHFYNTELGNSDLQNNSIRDILADNQGNVWFGSYYGGVYQYNPSLNNFQAVYTSLHESNKISHPIINSLLYKGNKEIFIATEGGGIDVLNYHTKQVRSLGIDKIKNKIIKDVQQDSHGNLWIGTLEGLYTYNLKAKICENYFTEHPNFQKEGSISILSLLIDSSNNIWIGTNFKGLYRLNNQSEKPILKKINGIVGVNINVLMQGDNNNLYIGTDQGINVFDPKTEEAHLIYLQGGKNSKTTNTNVISLCKGANASLWIGTYGDGLFNFDSRTQKITQFTINEGLPSNIINGIFQENSKTVWLSTNKGICRLDIAENEIIKFNTVDGLHGDIFQPGATLVSPDGKVFFGGINGITYFNPVEINLNKYVPEVVFTDLLLFNESIRTNSNYNYPDFNIGFDSEIVLPYDARVITIEFAALNYLASIKNKYAFQLQGFYDTWTYSEDKRSVTYTNLLPGKYTFRVKASNNHNVWNNNEKQFAIIIKPPFWKTWYAFLFYSAMVILLLWLYKRINYSMVKIKNDLLLEQIQNDNIRKVNQLKLNFFTNISHEFRTPLTLIINPINRIRETLEGNKQGLSQLDIMEKNANRLFRLVNELLEFRKVETGNLELKTSKNDIVLLVLEIKDLFNAIAAERSINYIVKTDLPSYEMWFDPEKLEKVLVNLLSNAFRSTPLEGEVKIIISKKTYTLDETGFGNFINNAKSEQNGEYIEIVVRDTGIGIAKDKMDLIFERYFHDSPMNNESYAPSGMGIGLALSKKLVEMLSGTIAVDSVQGQGSSFIVRLPVNKEGFSEGKIVNNKSPYTIRHKTVDFDEINSVEKAEIVSGNNEFKPSILLVDDNVEIINYLKQELSGSFKILFAENGKKGLAMARANLPHVVISDIMMPVMDGIELCKELKNDFSTSHIPVILLTAKNNEDSQIEGINTGADIYISKPFMVDVLVAQINNLIRNRLELQKKFARLDTVVSKDLTSNELDKQFIEKLIAYIEQEMNNPEFDIVALCAKIGMSRSVLYRKLKSILDVSPQDFIRSIRLKRAAILLKEGISIECVSTDVGFINSKHFSTIFKKQFGVAPSVYKSGDHESA